MQVTETKPYVSGLARGVYADNLIPKGFTEGREEMFDPETDLGKKVADAKRKLDGGFISPHPDHVVRHYLEMGVSQQPMVYAWTLAYEGSSGFSSDAIFVGDEHTIRNIIQGLENIMLTDIIED